MATSEQVRPWIQQAKADLQAARVDSKGIAECHRRYWAQQVYEKAMKALTLIWFKGSEEEDNALCGLLSHSPLKHLERHIDDPKSALPKELSRKRLFTLERQVRAFVRTHDEHGWLRRIDDLEPSKKPTDVSYRYPFFDGESNYIAPTDFRDWDSHLGGIAGAVGAVEKLLQAVDDEFKAFKRTPK